MAFLAPIATVFSAIAGGVSSIMGMQKAKEKPPAQQALPATPTVQGAQDTAKEALEKRRRISLLQGGNTDVTRGSAMVGGDSLGKKSLLGV